MSKTRDDYEAEAREVADAARWSTRLVFQVKHPHYTPPVEVAETCAEVHAAAKLAFATEGQQYDRERVHASCGLDMGALLDTVTRRR